MCNDEILWRGMMDGDREMFLALYRKYYHSLLFIGLKKIRDPHLVKDAIQQQFMYLWEKRGTIQEAKSVRAYLINSFLRKLAADWIKTEKSTRLEVAWSNVAHEPLPSPEENLIANQDQRQLHEYLMHNINALPARQKELIVMKFYEGLNYDEIVQKTGLAHRTVYNKIHEALKKLKLDIEKEQSAYGAALSIQVIVSIASLFLPG
ncbi:RNA polymerase sigma factor [Flavihumibacter profundi]|uniref:RNA polymerase sigma factor n=1 Tax=Flavihumibacter profundi TaxID=2716883 RepID=UPI001CC79437|nr:sigma-70 family RNA polymerase sigma factor [Flavihumibacter profundi]MBZ5856917.1 sigma-70 family RNA polymerase sigma factor [Flavihumibacter profundi]